MSGVGWSGFAPLVNEPQGNEQVKLSFERVALAPGESAKISVCINPEVEGSDAKQIQFEWTAGESRIMAAFGGKAALTNLQRKLVSNVWHEETNRAGDLENRTIVFI